MGKLKNIQIQCEKKLKKLLKKYQIDLRNREIIIGGDFNYIRGEFLDYSYSIYDDTLEICSLDSNKSKDEIWLEIWDYENEEEMITDYIHKIEVILKKYLYKE